MSGITKISWAERSWNPVTGCSHVSEGCRNCYAESLSLRMGWSKKPWTAVNAAENIVLHPERLGDPLKWRKPARVFVNSMSDLFHERIPLVFFQDCWRAMHYAHQKRGHEFLILTKRPERMNEVLGPRGIGWYAKEGPVPCPEPGIWLGASCEQRQWLSRLDILRDTPAAIRFVSFEPLLEGLGAINLDGIHWVIVGGESGVNHRQMEISWVEDIVSQCKAAGVAVFVKQDSDRYPGKQGRIPDNLWLKEWPTGRRAAR